MTFDSEKQEVKPEFYNWLNSWADKEKTAKRLKPIFGTPTEMAAFKIGYDSAVSDILEKVKSTSTLDLVKKDKKHDQKEG